MYSHVKMQATAKLIEITNNNTTQKNTQTNQHDTGKQNIMMEHKHRNFKSI